MAENKTEKQPQPAEKEHARHGKRAEERRRRQAEALRENLKKRKGQIRQRSNPDGKI